MLRPEVREALRSESEDTAAPHAPEQSCSLGCGADDWSCLGIAPPDPDSADEEASRAPPAEFEKDIEWGAGGDDDTATATSVEEDEKAEIDDEQLDEFAPGRRPTRRRARLRRPRRASCRARGASCCAGGSSRTRSCTTCSRWS